MYAFDFARPSTVAEAVELLLRLPLGRFSRQDLLRFATHPVVMASQPDARIEDWLSWCDRLGIVPAIRSRRDVPPLAVDHADRNPIHDERLLGVDRLVTPGLGVQQVQAVLEQEQGMAVVLQPLRREAEVRAIQEAVDEL